jgi:hypothetical protein
MGIEVSQAEQAIVRKMISRKTAWWCLMKLPNGQWGALWEAGIDIGYGSGFITGIYSDLAYIGGRKDTVEFIINDLKRMAASDPDNCPFKEQYIKDLAWKRT